MPAVQLDMPSAAVARLRINRPEARNALNQEVRELLAGHFTAL